MQSTFIETIRAGNVEVFQEKVKILCFYPRNYINEGIKAKQPKMFNILFDMALQKYELTKNEEHNPCDDFLWNSLRLAISTGDLEIVKQVYARYDFYENFGLESELQLICARNGYLDVLIYIREKTCTELNAAVHDIFILAAGYGHLNIVKWLFAIQGLASAPSEGSNHSHEQIVHINPDYEIIICLKQFEVLIWLIQNHLMKQHDYIQLKENLIASLKVMKWNTFDGDLNIVPNLKNIGEVIDIFNYCQTCQEKTIE